MGWSPAKGRDLGLGPRPGVRGLTAEKIERARSSEHARALCRVTKFASNLVGLVAGGRCLQD